MPAAEPMPRARFAALLIALLTGYLVLQFLYVIRQPLIADEFAGADEVHSLTHGVPYRDYSPYKTVLGYAIQSVAASLANSPWTRLIAIKVQMAVVNTVMLAIVGVWAARRFGRRPALLAVVVMICSSTFFERSSELRVDMLTAWFGVLALMALLDGKPLLAGVLLAVGFGVSQKAGMYVVAGEAALLASFLHRRDRTIVRSFLLFNAALAAGIVLYVLAWSIPCSFDAVVSQIFGVMKEAAGIAIYDIRWRYWSQALVRNPFVFAWAAIALWVLWKKRDIFLAVFAIVILAQAIWYPTPWPYFFLILWPVLFVLHAAAFEALPRMRIAAYGAFIALAVLYPALRLPFVFSRDNGYQRASIELADALLLSGETYLAAAPLLPHRQQPIERLKWIGAAEIAQLRKEPAEVLQSIVEQLAATPPKLLLANYRIHGLPPTIRNWLDLHYAQLAGSVYVYAPRIAVGRMTVELAYSGRYRLELPKPEIVVRLDGRPRRNGELLELSRGVHEMHATTDVRLRLLPHGVEQHIDPAYLSEQVFFPNLYDE
jgi:hypothetical protein